MVAKGVGPTHEVGRVHSVETCGTVDGPGLRYVLFLSGCPLRCTYCHNPETQGRPCGEVKTVDEVLTDLSRYRRFLRRGGLTVSGGEPLMQPAFTTALVRGAHEAGFHTAMDTSGVLGARAPDELLDAVDLVLLDIKAGTEETFHSLTGGRLSSVLRFAKRLDERGISVWVRFVLAPGLTDAMADVDGVAAIVSGLGNVERVEILPMHHLGAVKYQALGRAHPIAQLRAPSSDDMQRVRDVFADRGVEVVLASKVSAPKATV